MYDPVTVNADSAKNLLDFHQTSKLINELILGKGLLNANSVSILEKSIKNASNAINDMLSYLTLSFIRVQQIHRIACKNETTKSRDQI